MPARPNPEGREVIKRTKDIPKQRPASAVGMPRTNQQTKKPVEQTKPKATPKPKTEPKGPIANSTPKIDTNKTKPKSQKSDKKSNTLKVRYLRLTPSRNNLFSSSKWTWKIWKMKSQMLN